MKQSLPACVASSSYAVHVSNDNKYFLRENLWKFSCVGASAHPPQGFMKDFLGGGDV